MLLLWKKELRGIGKLPKTKQQDAFAHYVPIRRASSRPCHDIQAYTVQPYEAKRSEDVLYCVG